MDNFGSRVTVKHIYSFSKNASKHIFETSEISSIILKYFLSILVDPPSVPSLLFRKLKVRLRIKAKIQLTRDFYKKTHLYFSENFSRIPTRRIPTPPFSPRNTSHKRGSYGRLGEKLCQKSPAKSRKMYKDGHIKHGTVVYFEINDYLS